MPARAATLCRATTRGTPDDSGLLELPTMKSGFSAGSGRLVTPRLLKRAHERDLRRSLEGALPGGAHDLGGAMGRDTEGSEDACRDRPRPAETPHAVDDDHGLAGLEGCSMTSLTSGRGASGSRGVDTSAIGNQSDFIPACVTAGSGPGMLHRFISNSSMRLTSTFVP
jgi:hypothetical protein